MYRKNYSPITYEKDDIPDLFAAASRDGMRSPTFLPSGSWADTDEAPTFRKEGRDIHATMRAHESDRDEDYIERLPARPRHAHAVSPWFALASGMVVAGAFVMALVAVAPESIVPHGAIAKVVEKALTATVFYSSDK